MSRRTNRKKVPLKQRLAQVGDAVRSGVRFLAPLVVIAAIAVLVPFGILLGYLHVVSTPYFALDDITVQGVERLDEATVLRKGGVERGANAFDVDPERVELRLEALPWVRRAHVQKRLPRTLHIQIEERRATAVLVDDGAYTLLDVQGEPFKQLDGADPVDELLELPLITGLSRAEAEAESGQQLVLEALEVVRLAAEQKLPALSEVHIDPVMGLSIVPAETGIEIRLGRGRYPERLERLRAVFAAIEREGREVDYILLDNEESLNRVTVGNHAMDRVADAPKKK